MRRVSSGVRGRVDPAGVSFPLISTSGGFPGEKKRSLIFDEVLSIAVSRSGVEMGAAAGAAAVAVLEGEKTGFGTLVGEDIKAVLLWQFPALPGSTHKPGESREYGGKRQLASYPSQHGVTVQKCTLSQ